MIILCRTVTFEAKVIFGNEWYDIYQGGQSSLIVRAIFQNLKFFASRKLNTYLKDMQKKY